MAEGHRDVCGFEVGRVGAGLWVVCLVVVGGWVLFGWLGGGGGCGR